MIQSLYNRTSRVLEIGILVSDAISVYDMKILDMYSLKNLLFPRSLRYHDIRYKVYFKREKSFCAVCPFSDLGNCNPTSQSTRLTDWFYQITLVLNLKIVVFFFTISFPSFGFLNLFYLLLSMMCKFGAIFFVHMNLS